MDPLSFVADEVALEGLDGITIPSLWVRLENRKPKFPLKLDDCTKELIWKSLVNNTDLKFHELPRERDDVALFDRYKAIDPEFGIETELDTWKDIYPIHIVENQDGIQGSCALFKQRTDVTKHVRSKSLTPLLNLQETLERYGRKLVVVASQMLRFRTLIGTESDPDLKVSDDSYCVLERVGRARWQGELQKDLHRCSFKIDARKLHYLRKSLVKHGLVSMQSYCTRNKSGQQQHSILLLLKRFHVNRRSKYDLLMESTSNLLQHTPGQFATCMVLRAQLNVDEGTFRRVIKYLRSAKLIELCQYPLEDLDPGAGPCLNKKGNKVLVRCVRFLKPYTKKGVTEEDDDEDDEEEDDSEARLKARPQGGRIMEQDILSQAYHIILSCGTKGIPQRDIRFRMNIGRLESRMICRKLERDGLIKGFMEDEGRQRTTKFISHTCVGESDRLQMFAKEQERNKLLSSSARPPPAAPKTPPASKSTGKEKRKTAAAKRKRGKGRKKEEEEEEEPERARGDGEVDVETAKGNTTGNKETQQSDFPVAQPAPAGSEAAACSKPTTATPDLQSTPTAEQVPVEEEEEEGSTSVAPSDPPEREIVEVKNIFKEVPEPGRSKKSHETYRMLRRKNLIVEAVHNLKIVEGLFPLQKMINDEEKQDGISSKCCKKTILRIIHGLSREGLVKLYNTTVIQDGITKKVELVVHPSVQPNDDIVNQAIEQIRFKISSSYTVVRLQHAEEKAREQRQASAQTAGSTSRTQRSKTSKKMDEDFKPTTVQGLGKSFGFQPKMPRLRMIHTFLWYLMYGHQDRVALASQTPDNPALSGPPPGSVDPQNADSGVSTLDVEEEELKESGPGPSESNMKVYLDEDSWKRFVPPVRVHKEFGSGWAMVGDLLLCLPLSIFIQVVQINYKVDGLEEYLNHPVKQYFLVRVLPAKMRRQLLYRRKYIFTFLENLQKLVYMGLVHFGPQEKFMDKDQVFLYLKHNITIVDTTNADPHYWLVSEDAEKPFERRRYTFNTAEDVENYWFDLMCVCLNTPLGVVRNKRNASVEERDPSFVHEPKVFIGLAHLLKGSREVCDDGSVPGDGKGAAGLDSEFFGHLKRNWFWTSHLLRCRTIPSGLAANENKVRLKSLLSKNLFRYAIKAGKFTAPRKVTSKRPLIEKVKVDVQPASRNQQVVGGKGQKRKRSKKEVVKAPRKKKKEPRQRTPAHDEADHRALKMMTRQRVNWSVQEDSLMMLCSVASHLLNSKLKRPFVPFCAVRDLLHSEFDMSADKTSVAVGRRSRYILKNPQTLLNYRICLAEVFQDKPLLELLEGNQPDNPENPEDCSKVFMEYVRRLRQKFSSSLNICGTAMPDTKQQLFQRFRVLAIDDIKQVPRSDTLNCTDDIHAIVLDNLIQSTLAMTNSQMKSSRSFQTFQLYSKYSQELLCQAFIQCRKRGLVNRRRVHQPFGPKKNRALPILPMSYQLSQSYFRCFSSRFPHSLCTESFRFLRTLVNSRLRDDRLVTVFHHEPEHRADHAAAAAERKRASDRKKRQSDGKEGGGPAGEPEERAETASSSDAAVKEGGSDRRNVEEETEQKSRGDELGGGSAEDPSSEEVRDVSDMLLFPLDSPGGACVASLSLICLGLLNVYISIPKQIVVVDSNLVDKDVAKTMAALEEDDEDDEDGEECEGRKKMEVKAHQASHTKYLMMRGYCSPGIVKRRDINTTDNIVVESCFIRLQLRNTPAHNVLHIEDSPPLDLTKCGPSLLPPNLSYSCSSPSGVPECEARLVQRRGYTPQDTDACAELRRSLDAAGENGVDVRDFHQDHVGLEEPQAGRSRRLQQYMEDLEEEGQVLKVGGLGARWVLMKHADPWLLVVKSKPRSQSGLTSDALKSQESGSSTRRRGRRQVQQDAEEPPAKKPTLDRREGENTESLTGDATEPNEEEALKEKAGEGSGDELLKAAREDGKPHGEEGCSSPGAPAGENDGENVNFISRPWRMVDGGLNRLVCKGMLEGVLSRIMSQPGLTQQALVEHYKDVLQPLAVLDLVQALIALGCVTKKTLVKLPKPSLFSRSVHQPKHEAPRKREEPDAVYYEPTVSCCLRLAQVLPNERHWNNYVP